MSSIFISYSRKDLAIAEKIVFALAESKLDTWIDTINIPKGEKLKQEIYHGIESANAILFLVSPASVNSKWCEEEISHATLNNKRIIPILIKDTDEASIPIDVKERLWIECREKQSNFDNVIKEIVNAIIADNEWVKYHTRLQLRALDWENRKDNSRLLRGRELQEAEQQLASAGSKKDPQPTDLQRHYVLISRKDDAHRRRRSTTILVFALFIITTISIFAFIQRNNAIDREIARATAQAISEEQANIALARHLATQAQLLYNEQDNSILVATLLAIESEKRFPNAEANKLIRNSIDLLLPIDKKIVTNHINEITDIAFSPDGKLIASSSLDKTVRIFSTDTGNEIYILQHTNAVTDINFNYDSKILYTISEGKYIYIWDAIDGLLIQEIFFGEGIVNFTSDGKIIVTNIQDGFINVWKVLENNDQIAISNDSIVKTITISPDGKNIAVLTEDNLVKVWNTQTGQLVNQRFADAIFSAVVFSPDSKFIVSLGQQSSNLWDIYTGEVVTNFGRGKDGEVSYDFDPNGNSIATTGINSPIVKIWDTNTGELIKELTHDFFISNLAYTPDGKHIITGSLDDVIKVWDLTTLQESGRTIISGGQLIVGHPNRNTIALVDNNIIHLFYTSSTKDKSILPYTGYSASSKIDPIGKWIASWDENENIIYVLDIFNNTQKEIELESQVNTLSFSDDGNLLVSGENNGKTCIWQIITEAKINCYPQKSTIVAISPDLSMIGIARNPNGLIGIWNIQSGELIFNIQMELAITDIKFSPDNKYIAISSIENYVSLWDVILQKEKAQLPHEHIVNNISFIRDTNLLISNSRDGTAKLWNLDSLNEVSRISYNAEEFLNSENVLKTITNPNHTQLASVNAQALNSIIKSQETEGKNNDVSTIRIWDPISGDELIRLIHGSWVNDIVWSQDGKYVLSGGEDGIVRIWDVKNGNETGKITHNTSITQIQLSSNNRQIISLSDDGTYKISDLQPKDIISQGCFHITRNLSLSEWKQYLGNIPYQVTCENLPIPNN